MLNKFGWQNAESDLKHHPHLHCNQWLIPPYLGESNERRNSLPSPSAAFNQEEGFFKSGPTQPVLNFGNISPGDGPLPIRPYHAIIEGSDKWVNSFTVKRFTVWVIQLGKSLLMLMFGHLIWYKVCDEIMLTVFAALMTGENRFLTLLIYVSFRRKGSLKGRKWMSIFNIGGRFHDPRRRHKHSAKGTNCSMNYCSS